MVPAAICFIGRNGGTGDIASVTSTHLTAGFRSKADASATAHAGMMMLIDNRDLKGSARQNRTTHLDVERVAGVVACDGARRLVQQTHHK